METARHDERPAGERRARIALILLCLLAPAVYLPRVLLGRETPLPLAPPPAWVHVVVVTAGAWEDLAESFEEGGPAFGPFAEFDRRSSRIASCLSPSPASASAAASLWTGRYPASHGVSRNDLALAPGTWTLARAARSAGTRTAAFLQEPFASATAIGGFDEVVERDAGSTADLVRDAADFLASIGDDRALVWIHLRDAGQRGGELTEAVARLSDAIDATDRGPETAFVVALLARRDTGTDGAPKLGALSGPLWISMPGALAVGRRSEARVSLVDVGAMLTLTAGLRVPPGATPDGRADFLWNAVRGGGGDLGAFVQSEVLVWTRGGERAVLDPRTGSGLAERRGPGGTWTPLVGEAARTVLGAAETAQAAMQPAGERPVPARVPPGDWGPGW